MKTIEKDYTVGVIVARFQVDELHEAHKELIDTVLSKHPKVMIFLGLSDVKGSINDPLHFQPRKQMILENYPHEKFPNLMINYIKDCRDDAVWSVKLDGQIRDVLSPTDSVVMYGSRDSFLVRYSGKFDVRELQATRHISGTELREKISKAPLSDKKFRTGVIFASYQRYPTVYSTTDVVVFDPKERRVLLARKPNEQLYRFPGGFVSTTDDSFEDAALRELEEETDLTIGLPGLRYVGSKKVNDWRYADNPSEKIMTHLYVGLYGHGAPKAKDDIAEVRWFDYDKLNKEASVYDEKTDLTEETTEAKLTIVEEHRPLWDMAKTYIDTNFPE
jgi:bifunctional NMN adenylyltransferase/nudix hydrolase